MSNWSEPGAPLPEPEPGKTLLIKGNPEHPSGGSEMVIYYAWADDGEPCVWETHARRGPARDRQFQHDSDCWMLVEANPHRKAA